MTEKTKALMIMKKDTADLVLSKVQKFHNDGELHLPEHYSAANALKGAWLMLQTVKDKNGKPALEACSKVSIANALLDMVIQGLSVAKKQAYFIVRGNVLCLDRSYFGAKAVSLRLNPEIKDIYAEVVYEGDNLEYRIEGGRKIIEDHTQKLQDVKDSNIIAAYATAVDRKGNVLRSELMTIEQIHKSWKQSKMKPFLDNGDVKPDSVHGKFPTEMARRTVTARLSKHFINTSDDSDLVIESVNRTDDVIAQTEAAEEIEDFSNSEVIDVGKPKTEDTERVVDAGKEEGDTGEPSREEQLEILEQEKAEGEKDPLEDPDTQDHVCTGKPPF